MHDQHISMRQGNTEKFLAQRLSCYALTLIEPWRFTQSGALASYTQPLGFYSFNKIFFFAKKWNQTGPKTFEYQWQEWRHYLHAKKYPFTLFLMSRILLAGRCSFHCSPQEDTHLEIDSFDSIVPLAIIAFHWLRTLQHQDISLQCFAGCSLLCCCANRAEKSRTFP